MNYNEIDVNGFLSHFIKCFWQFENVGKDISYTILPDGCFDLLIHLKDNQLQSINLTGLWTKEIEVTIPANAKIIGIRFKLIASEYIFKRPLRDLLNTKIKMPDHFWGIKNLPLHNLDKLVDILSDQLHQSFRKIKELDSRKLNLFEVLYQNNGFIGVAELADQVCWTERQINRYFNKHFGFSLKAFTNILKCNASYHHIAKGQLYPLHRYYDQAHFIKEIKRYTGATPRSLFQNKNDRFLQLSTLTSM